MGLLSRIERRATLENPSTSLANPDEWLVEVFGGGESAAGVDVGQRSALRSDPVWACVNVIAQDVAKLPLITYRRLDRGKERATDHGLYPLLKERPNPQMSSTTLRKTLQAHVLTWGNAFAEKEFNGAGDVVGLWPLLPDRTDVRRVDGRKFFVTRVNGQDIPLAEERVLHIPGLGFDGLRGYSVIHMARDQIGSQMAAQQFGGRFFSNGARPGGVITRSDSLSEDARQRLRKSWNQMHQGLTRAQRVAVLDEGMDYKMIGVPPEDAQFIGTKQFSVPEICRFFRVPPHKVQDLSRATFSNIEQESRSYVQDTLQYWLVTWEQELNRSLFTDDEEHFPEFVVEGLLRGDSGSRAEFYERGIRNGWMTPNEVRQKENLNPKDGGDKLFLPLDLFPLDEGAPPPEPQGDDEPDLDDDEAASGREALIRRARETRSLNERERLQKSHRRGFAAVAQRVVDEEVRRLRGLLDRLESRDAAEFLSDVNRFYEDFEAEVRSEFGPLVTSYAESIRAVITNELGTQTEPDLQYEHFIEKYVDGMARRHVVKGEKQIRKVVSETPVEEQSEAVGQRLDEWEEKRADKIAGSESVRAMGALSKAAYLSGGILSLMWREIGESCPYCRKLDGQVVGIRDNFLRKGEFIEPDGEKEPMKVRKHIGHPPAHGGCDCLISPGGF